MNPFRQTAGERQSYRDGISLFFGALIGANLGTLKTLALGDYVRFVLLLAGAVLALQLIAHARSRRYALAMIAFYAVLLGVTYAGAAKELATLRQTQIDRIFATLAIWLGAILIIELTPLTATAAKTDLT